MNRAGHYVRAEELAEQAQQAIARSETYATLRRAAREDAHLYLKAAQIHATLAAAAPGVEAEVIAQAERQAARPPLTPKPGPPITKAVHH